MYQKRVGRIEDIPMGIARKEFDYSESPVTGDQLAEEMKLPKNNNTPIYFTSNGWQCSCGNFMVSEVPRRGKQVVWCSNQNCSEHMIEKIVDLPFTQNYVVRPSNS